jgi:dihydrofolate reductase
MGFSTSTTSNGCVQPTPCSSAPRRTWTETTTIVPRADARRAVADLKGEPGGDILMFGSRTLWKDLLAAGLVDELHLMVGATVLGAGTPAFGAVSGPSLRLLETRRRDGSSNLLVRYEVLG